MISCTISNLFGIEWVMYKLSKNTKSGYVIVFLAFLLPIIFASIFFAINFTERTSIYSHKDCSADAALVAIKNYNFGATFDAQKLGLLSKADNVYNDKAIMHNDKAIKHEELIITPICFSVTPTDTNITEFNQFVGLFSSIDMAYRQGFFYDENYIKNAKYIASECKVLDVSIPNTGINLACNCILPAEKGFNGYCNAYTGEHENGMKFTFNKNTNTTSKTINLSRRSEPTNKLDIRKDGDSLVVDIKDDKSGKTYSSKAVPAKCNVDIIMCIPTNSAACNENNLDIASVSTGNSTGLPLHVELGESTPSINVKNTPIYQISQACKKFIKDNFMSTQGVCVGLVPYSGKLSIPHYRFLEWGCYQPHFNDTYLMLYVDTNVALRNTIMGYYLYGSCGDPTKVLHHKNSTIYAVGVVDSWHKYGVNIRHQKGKLSNNYGNYDYEVDISDIPVTKPTHENGYLLSTLYPAYLGYANVLRGKADKGSIDYLPNPYYIIELTPDMVKICDLLECFRPINDEYSCSNFLFLPFYWSNALLNYSWSDDPGRSSDTNYFSQESKLTTGRNKVVILFVNKPDHFEPGEMTYLGFSNDNQEFDLAESDAILFNTDYSSNEYKFYDGTTLGSLCKTTSPNVELYGQKKILKFKQLSGKLVKVPDTANEKDQECPDDYFWKVPEESITTAKLSFPQKHLIKLVFEGDYLNEEIKHFGTINFSSKNGVSDCKTASGETVPLDTDYKLTKETEFVFSGPDTVTWEGKTLTAYTDNIQFKGGGTRGKNFELNLSPYKVKFNKQRTDITGMTLKNQFIRAYNFGLSRGGSKDDPTCNPYNSSSKSVIVRDGRVANYPADLESIQTLLEENESSTEKMFEYMLYFCDMCFSYGKKKTSVGDDGWISLESGNYIEATINGIDSGIWFLNGYAGYKRGEKNVIRAGVKAKDNEYDFPNIFTFWNIPMTTWASFSSYDKENKRTYFKATGTKPALAAYLFMFRNNEDKELLGTNFVDANELNTIMANNAGICLHKLENDVSSKITAGNYICFQGDGELHMTCKPDTNQYARGLYLSNLKDLSYVTVIDHGSNLRPNRKVLYIDPQAIANDVDEDGNYHIDLMMNNVKLISAEITNKTYTKEDPKITITETAAKSDDVVTESNGIKTTEPGDTTTTYQIIANDSRPVIVTVDKDMVLTRTEEPYGTVNFSSENGVSACKTVSGEKVPLDTDYKFYNETEFVFSGPNLPISGSTTISRQSSSGGVNFGHNLSIYKVKYSLNNALINENNSYIIKQVIRNYFGYYGRGLTSYKPLILNNGNVGICASCGTYNAYKNGASTYSGYKDFGVSGWQDINKIVKLLGDSCISYCDTSESTSGHTPEYGNFESGQTILIVDTNSKNKRIEQDVFGVKSPFVIYASNDSSYKSTLTYYATGGSTKPYEYCGNGSWNSFVVEAESEDNFKIHISILGECNIQVNQVYYLNQSSLEEDRKVEFISNITDSDLLSNNGIGTKIVDNDISSKITAGDYICFQGDGELHVKIAPTGTAKKTDIYRGSYTYKTKSAYQHGDMNTPYKWYNTQTKTLNTVGNSWNYEVTQGSGSPLSSETFVLSPDVATYTRGQNGEYIYTITTVNAKISADFVDNKSKVYHFAKRQAPVGQRSVDFYRSTENHKNDLTYTQDNIGDIHAQNSSTSDATNGSFDYMYHPERLFPDISHANNTSYWNYTSKIFTFPMNYHGDRTTYMCKSDLTDHYATCQIVNSLDNVVKYNIIPCDTRIFKAESRHTGSIREFICDSWSKKHEYLYNKPYASFIEVQMSSYTYPNNYALTQFANKYKNLISANKYDQDSILKKLTEKCASDLKAKSSTTKVYIVKYRKQDKTRPFPVYTTEKMTWYDKVEMDTINCDYDYLDFCVSGSNYIFDCSTPEELESVMSKIAEKVKQEASYTTAHCEIMN